MTFFYSSDDYNHELYIIKQKIGNHIYAYEAESYYDKEKKQPRQRRKYLGRVDLLTGRIVETSRTKTKHISLPKSAKSIDAVHSESHNPTPVIVYNITGCEETYL